jgi:hypothetical protein
LSSTTEAPILPPSHPFRSAFTRYGRYAARHVVVTLLISVAVAAILIYPFPFLFTTDFTNGASNLPHHVWTVAQPLEYQGKVEPDVIMRSIWVHGSYMQALERDVLIGALRLQNELLGPTKNFNPRQPTNHVTVEDTASDLTPKQRDTFHILNGLTDESWFFHSPLQYWSCSADRINSDQNILNTVNQRKNQPTSVNVTLRHSIVFSGKRFEDRQLLAADALVITLIHLRDSPVGRQWERKAKLLAETVTDQWDIYPPDGASMPGRLFEFQFRPISTQDAVILALAYSLTCFYFMMSLTKLRAVKSKFGLIVTVLAQIVVSSMSSFTICAIFKVDLSRIPRAAYPVVVLSMSLENIFRLINAVIVTPSEDSTSSRIGHAFGETAQTALASTMQNVLILWALSRVVSPGVSAFCIFVAVAIIFDFFYLSTFFLSVLSVDVRRTELSDALARASLRKNRRSSDPQPRSSWVEAMLQGKIALSTRIAGTIVMFGSVLVAQWHFFENESIFRLLGRLFNVVETKRNLPPSRSSLLVDIHQARSPTSWLRMQDHDTAREVINVIKPWAHSYIARVYEPLVFVAKGSDRMPHATERPFLPAVYDFLHHQLTPFIVTVIVVLAAVRLLTNYLLWGEEESDSMSDSDYGDEPWLSMKSLSSGHTLDIALLAASNDGQVVSVGLDRLIRVWNVRPGGESYVLTELDAPSEDPFPILAIAIDSDSNWLALLSSTRIYMWNLAERRWGGVVPIDLQGQKAEAFFFAPTRTEYMYPLIVVRRNGTATQISPDIGVSNDFSICKSPLASAMPLVQKPGSMIGVPGSPIKALIPNSAANPPQQQLSVVTMSRRGCVHIATQSDGEWVSKSLAISEPSNMEIHQVLPLASIGCLLIARSHSVDLIDVQEHRVFYTFQTEPIQPRSLKCFHSPLRKAPCGLVGLGSLTLVYNNAETDDCIIQTYLPQEDGDTICFQDSKAPSGSACCPWEDTREMKKHVTNPGVWDALHNGCVVGVRRKSVGRAGSQSPTQGGMRQRITRSESRTPKPSDEWEAWLVSQLGRQELCETWPISREFEEDGQLMVTQLGPLVKVGTASLAIGFGNIIKLITIGHERYNAKSDMTDNEQALKFGTRRRRAVASTPRSKITSVWT